MKTVSIFRTWPFFLILKELLKNSNPLQSNAHFSKLLPSKPSQHSARTCVAHNFRQRAKWAPFDNTNWLYWLLPISLRQYLSEIREGLTSLWRNLLVWVIIARYNPFYYFKEIKPLELTFPLVNMYCRNVFLDKQMALWEKTVKMEHFAFSMQNCTFFSVAGSTNHRNEIIFGADYICHIR